MRNAGHRRRIGLRRARSSSRPGELLHQDTFYWGRLKGVGKLYGRVMVDVFCSLAFAKVYTSKMPVRACDLDRFLAHYHLERAHQGHRLKGKTPAQALREALGREDLPPVVPPRDDAQETAAEEVVPAT